MVTDGNAISLYARLWVFIENREKNGVTCRYQLPRSAIGSERAPAPPESDDVAENFRGAYLPAPVIAADISVVALNDAECRHCIGELTN